MPPLLDTRLSVTAVHQLRIECEVADPLPAAITLFVATATEPGSGSAVIPFQRGVEGSTVFLPFRATQLYLACPGAESALRRKRIFERLTWSGHLGNPPEFEITSAAGAVLMTIDLRGFDPRTKLHVAVYAKYLNENNGWGSMIAAADGGAVAGHGDRTIGVAYAVDVEARAVEQIRNRTPGPRVRIYQLLPRLFGNVNETRKANGTLIENGVGKFGDINQAAIRSLVAMGFTHVWLSGVLRHATATAYPEVELPADDADLLKGLAGSPYAIKDYFDVSPELAENPMHRLREFRELVERLHAGGLRVIIDFIGNHVARSYASTIHPELTFGAADDRSRFFDWRNNFFYLHDSGGLRLPTWKDGVAISATCKVLGTCDGRYDGERDHARVTGNDVASPEPTLHDWYETVKLNFGYDFTSRIREYPHGANDTKSIPDTWLKMDRVLAYWQELGVDGFRCDMAHMVPTEFWGWAIGRARTRQPDVFFAAEAYDNDPMKVPGGDPLLAALNDGKGNVMFDLLNAGFSAVYDDPSYRKLKALYDGVCWANDLDDALGHDFIFQNSLRYAENHDEVRLAGRDHWGNVGMAVGRPVSALLYGLSRGPVLLYSGQEVGEPADGAEGFGGDDARTTIFDYWSMPQLAKWVNGHRYDGARLSQPQLELRDFYARLLRLVGEPAFHHGEFFGLNRSNLDNPFFGRLFGDTPSGHWLYAFFRHDISSGQRFLVVANFHRDATMPDVRLQLSSDAEKFLALPHGAAARLIERLLVAPARATLDLAAREIRIGDVPALTPFYFELQIESTQR